MNLLLIPDVRQRPRESSPLYKKIDALLKKTAFGVKFVSPLFLGREKLLRKNPPVKVETIPPLNRQSNRWSNTLLNTSNQELRIMNQGRLLHIVEGRTWKQLRKRMKSYEVGIMN